VGINGYCFSSSKVATLLIGAEFHSVYRPEIPKVFAGPEVGCGGAAEMTL